MTGDARLCVVTSSERHWCCTCGEYVRPGTHGIHESNYGRGASVESPQPMSSASAVALVTAGLIALPILAFVAALLLRLFS